MRFKIITAALLLPPLGGCASVETLQRASITDDRPCRLYGAPGQAAYIVCLTQHETARTGRSCFGSCH
jgi:hypothetical protein